MLEVWNGTCCYDSGDEKIEICPFNKDGTCAADNFKDALDIIANRENQEKRSIKKVTGVINEGRTK